MNLADLPEAVQKLAALGNAYSVDENLQYRTLGIKREHIPALIEVVRGTSEWMRALETDEDAENDPQVWLPVHAWRALGQLQASEAVPTLLDTLRLIEDEENDIVQEDIPNTLALMKPEIIPAVAAYLMDTQHGLWARLAAAESLNLLSLNHPSVRDEVIRHLSRALEGYPSEDFAFNSFLISYLGDQKAVEAAELVEQVYTSDRVDISIMGDWEDFQVAVGLLEQRLTPARETYFDPFGDQRTGAMDFLRGHSREDSKTKKKRKQAKQTRRKNRKKKKK